MSRRVGGVKTVKVLEEIASTVTCNFGGAYSIRISGISAGIQSVTRLHDDGGGGDTIRYK